MPDLTLTEDQAMLQELAKEFAAETVTPNAATWEEGAIFPMDAIREAHDLGLLTLKIPERYGGGGMGTMEEVLVHEELGRGDAGFATAAEATMLATYPVLTGGTEAQKEHYLGRIVAGELASYCVTEPEAGSDVQALRTEAVRDGDEYILNGNKMWITGAGHANLFFVLAYTDRSLGWRGLSGFMVEADSPGISLGKKEVNMGQNCSDTRSVTFEDVRVPANALIGGEENGGWANAMKAFDLSRPIVAAHAVGNARGAFEEAHAYAHERETFGTAIVNHQAISFMLADMATKIEAARLLTWSAAMTVDRGERNTIQAAQAKLFAADICVDVTSDAVPVFGGYGYSEEYPVARRMRAAKIYQIYEGSSQVQRIIIARELNRRFRK